MKAPVLNIRADTNPDIGVGHVMRCIALGQAARNKGYSVNFISNCNNQTIESRLTLEGFVFFRISSDSKDKYGLKQTLDILKSCQNNRSEKKKQWLIADGYHFGENFQKSIKGNGFNLLVIDDYNHLPVYHADILLNQNVGAENFDYKTDKNTIVLKGLRYALVRKEFLNFEAPNQHGKEKTPNILVTMGGSDPSGMTLTIIKSLLILKHKKIKAKIVIGPAAPGISKLKAGIKKEDGIELVENADMPALMRWADFALTAAGSTCIELCYTGVPFLSIVTAENQEAIANNFDKQGVSKNIGWFSRTSVTKLAESIDSFIKEGYRKQKMDLVDGKGAERVIQQMERII